MKDRTCFIKRVGSVTEAGIERGIYRQTGFRKRILGFLCCVSRLDLRNNFQNAFIHFLFTALCSSRQCRKDRLQTVALRFAVVFYRIGSVFLYFCRGNYTKPERKHQRNKRNNMSAAASAFQLEFSYRKIGHSRHYTTSLNFSRGSLEI